MIKSKPFLQRPATWGVFVLTLWALLLAVLSLANLLLLMAGADSFSGLGVVWFIFILSSGYSLGFILSAYGLWQQKNWGRFLFLWTVGIWSITNLAALFAPGIFQASQNHSTVSLILSGLRYLISFILPFWYLNLAHIKALFD